MLRPTSILRAPHGQQGNITGFDARKFREAATKPCYDPWERYEQWRYTGLFSRWNRLKGALPGLGIATVAFTAYCGFEYFFLKDDHHHSEGHGEKHH